MFACETFLPIEYSYSITTEDPKCLLCQYVLLCSRERKYFLVFRMVYTGWFMPCGHYCSSRHPRCLQSKNLYQYGAYSQWLRRYGCILKGLTFENAVLWTGRRNSRRSQLSGRLSCGWRWHFRKPAWRKVQCKLKAI